MFGVEGWGASCWGGGVGSWGKEQRALLLNSGFVCCLLTLQNSPTDEGGGKKNHISTTERLELVGDGSLSSQPNDELLLVIVSSFHLKQSQVQWYFYKLTQVFHLWKYCVFRPLRCPYRRKCKNDHRQKLLVEDFPNTRSCSSPKAVPVLFCLKCGSTEEKLMKITKMEKIYLL